MLYKKLVFLGTLLFTFMVSDIAIASGSSGVYGGGSSRSSGSVGSSSSRTDVTYEHGKSIFKGRNRRYGKLKYCIDNGEELEKVKRGTLKPYKSGSAELLADKLYNCEMPEEKISDILSRNDLISMLYYLNKRYKLKLN